MNTLLYLRISQAAKSLAITLAVWLTCTLANAANGPVANCATSCAGTQVQVSAADPDDCQVLCLAARQAIEFFQDNGLAVKQTVPVEVLADAASGGRSIEIGRFDAATGEVQLMSFDAFRSRWGGIGACRSPVSRALYQSFGVHEIAHALADEHFDMSPAPPLAQEYIAAAAQFTTMPPALRERILARHPVEAFESPASMSFLYYQMNPCAFMVKAYLHYRALEDPRAFMRQVLSGEISLGGEWW